MADCRHAEPLATAHLRICILHFSERPMNRELILPDPSSGTAILLAQDFSLRAALLDDYSFALALYLRSAKPLLARITRPPGREGPA